MTPEACAYARTFHGRVALGKDVGKIRMAGGTRSSFDGGFRRCRAARAEKQAKHGAEGCEDE